MADILIRGMEMPENCGHCRFAVEGWCYAYGKPNIPALMECEVSNFCPLVPLPEGHGRLIDGTDLYSTLDGGFDVDLDDLPETKDAILGMIAQADTIVPAEGGGEDG